MKKTTKIILALLVSGLATSCGSQLVEFPVDESCNCDAASGASSTASVGGDSGVGASGGGVTTTSSSSSSTTDHGGSGGESTTTSGSGGAGGAGECDDWDGQECYKNYGECVSACTHGCKDHEVDCPVFQECFKPCKEQCDCSKEACELE